jgi:hypothetical protein
MENAYEGVMQWIAQARAGGLSDTQITEQLIAQGWQADQIQKLLTPPTSVPTAQPVFVPKQTPTESVRTEIQQAVDPSAKVKGKSWPMRHVVLLVTVLGGIILLGGAAFAAYQGYIPMPFLQPNGEKILSDTLRSLETVRSGEVSVNVAINAQIPAQEKQDDDLLSGFDFFGMISGNTNITATFTSFFSTDSEDLAKLRGTFRLQGSYVNGGTSYAADVEARIIDRKVYLMANTLPSFPSIETGNFTKRWYVIGQDLSQPYFDQISKTNTNQQDLQTTRTEIATLLRLGVSNKAVIVGKVTRESLDGTSAFKVPVTFDSTKFSALAKAYEADATNRNVKTSTVKTIVDMFTEGAQDDTTPSLTLTIWSNPADAMLRKAEVAFTASEGTTDAEKRQVGMAVGITLAHVNEQPNVIEPTDAAPLMDTLEELLGGPQVASRNAQRKSDLGQLRTGLTLYYDEKKTYPESITALVDAKYLSQIPTPPNPNEQYAYTQLEEGQEYTVCAKLERIADNELELMYCVRADGTTSENPFFETSSE